MFLILPALPCPREHRDPPGLHGDREHPSPWLSEHKRCLKPESREALGTDASPRVSLLRPVPGSPHPRGLPSFHFSYFVPSPRAESHRVRKTCLASYTPRGGKALDATERLSARCKVTALLPARLLSLLSHAFSFAYFVENWILLLGNFSVE